VRYFKILSEVWPITRCLAFSLLLLSPLVFGQVYQWVDKDGNVHFGDSPPGEVDARAVDLPPGPSDEQVEQAQQRLQDALDARESDKITETAESTSQGVAQPKPRSVPEFACYTPVGQVLRGPTRAAYDPISPTDVTEAQRKGARDILSSAAGRWRGSSVELLCSGNIDSARSESLDFTVDSTGTWRDAQGLLILENRARGSRRRVDETRVSFIEIGDALYHFAAKGGGNQSINRTVAQRGNATQGLYLDDTSLAFMSRTRNSNVVRTDIRHLRVSGNNMEYTELFFHNNLLTGSRVWTLRR
jgi:hypothetical protein